MAANRLSHTKRYHIYVLLFLRIQLNCTESVHVHVCNSENFSDISILRGIDKEFAVKKN